ncbi:MAG: sigma-70 family RNA polymerase sigma factor [Flavobacteriaceae bacterium CG_4_8_14_3_um_filter_34_10]|nr:sigma-70 family RNA polymerase sigma factor [Flavobacteriia bacterium]OIP51455.1 MAG: RNA polymerase subunit sigma-24 [Flavobacteriaceae bacterium CG2_30_34_30]PIQ17500.1 MAG: RNA polymerase subunit sigma-24 [Flavobacteriaceae bacterium CG18_big_fil_WC_8_21_14_2_50_34_36]PIV50306.1 MAG: sigma-70 family RNA polymerase sigma factor [Flavobacteriaceae bacterium CG02_land_8_20_14_3_00_34_13]PIX08158.1 MAG: sigma-70 family RNA polymerase sigma factor [Flavobacteriaceae bacterium CG_4_8_14_3_um_fi
MSDKKIHEDQKYIEGLSQNNSFVIQSIYTKFSPKVIHYICNNSGDRDQAQDLIQEVLLVIYDQAKTKNLKLTCPFDAYFFLLCKRKWLNLLKKSSLQEVTINEEVVSINEPLEALILESENFEEKQSLYEVMFQKLGQACKELLTKSFQIDSMEEVAKALNVTYGYARKKKSLCIGQLTKMIQEAPGFTNLKNPR